MPTPIILDCDPGHDDAIALFLALASEAIELHGVTTVAGNQTLEKTTRNARCILTVAEREDVSVAAGCDRPLVRELQTAGFVHGESGLDGPDLPAPEAPLVDTHGVEYLIEQLEEADEPITLVPTGPLTNVGLALTMRPDLTDSIEAIVLMGGAFAEGNVTPAAEFNILVDPEAASIVFDADVPVTMVGLDVTRAGRLPTDRFAEFASMDNQVGQIVAELLEFYVGYHREAFGWDAVPIHDACAVAHVIDPSILSTEPMHVAVETAGTHTVGETVCDRWGTTENEPNASVALDIDTDAFHELLRTEIARF